MLRPFAASPGPCFPCGKLGPFLCMPAVPGMIWAPSDQCRPRQTRPEGTVQRGDWMHSAWLRRDQQMLFSKQIPEGMAEQSEHCMPRLRRPEREWMPQVSAPVRTARQRKRTAGKHLGRLRAHIWAPALGPGYWLAEGVKRPTLHATTAPRSVLAQPWAIALIPPTASAPAAGSCNAPRCLIGVENCRDRRRAFRRACCGLQ